MNAWLDLEQPDKWARGLKLTGLFCIGTFLVGFFFGTLIGVADPGGGWAAWRVGVLVGSIMLLAVFLIGIIATAMWVADID